MLGCVYAQTSEMCCLLYCRTITELRVNVNKVWLDHWDWPIKNDFIAPCFASMK